MSEKTVKARVQHKHDIEENWSKAANFIPKDGEIIIYDVDANHTEPRIKIGNGETVVGDLPFCYEASVIIERFERIEGMVGDIPVVDQIDTAIAGIDVQDEVYIGPGDMPEGYTLQIDIDGNPAPFPDLPEPTVDDAGLVLKVQEDGKYGLEEIEMPIPTPTADDAGKIIKVQSDGTYGLGEDDAGISEVPASIVTAGTLAGQVVANAEAAANLSVAQLRNIVCGTADVADVLDSLNVGDVYFTVEEEA